MCVYKTNLYEHIQIRIAKNTTGLYKTAVDTVQRLPMNTSDPQNIIYTNKSNKI